MIDWEKPVCLLDGTKLSFWGDLANPDGRGDYFLRRDDGRPFSPDQHEFPDCLIVGDDGREWRTLVEMVRNVE
jgi:hypothetical protein